MLTIERCADGPGWILTAEQLLPASREEVFDFFSDAMQLEAITPPWLNFHVATPTPIDIRQGTLIDYRLRLRGIPMRWQSEITAWEPPHRFVDEQRRGPYSLWHHEHVFIEQEGGTLCRDRVHYNVLGGRLVDWLIVERDIRKIFAFRQQKLASLFSVR